MRARKRAYKYPQQQVLKRFLTVLAVVAEPFTHGTARERREVLERSSLGSSSSNDDAFDGGGEWVSDPSPNPLVEPVRPFLPLLCTSRPSVASSRLSFAGANTTTAADAGRVADRYELLAYV